MSLRRIKTLLLLSFFVASIIGGVDIVLSSKKAQAAAGDAVAGSYGVAVDGSGNIDLSASAFSSIEWVHAALLRLTFKTGQVVDFTPINDKSNGMPPLIDQRINSAAGEGHVTYESTVWPCRATIDFDKNEDRDDSDFVLSILSDGVLDLDFRPESGAACADAGNFNVQPGNPNMSIAYFAWVDENTIATVDGESPGRFTRSDSASNFFIRDVDAEYESCIDKALVNIADNTLIWWELRDDGRVNFDGDPPGEAKTDEGCKYRTKIDDGGGRGAFNTGFPPNNRTLLIAGTPTTPVDISDLGTTSTDPNCESEGGVFSFILCPALTYANDAIGWLDDRIINALVINKDYYSAKEIKDAWANMRNIGYIVLIPILLLMVIGTALQFNFLDPYTVKRALPRLFVAIIFMAVSYDACRIMIEIVNGVGRGVSGIIAIPFGGFDKLTLQNIFTAPSEAGNVVWGGILAGVAIASLFVVSIGILFSYLFVAALAFLIIFILLSVRELMIIFLIIISPLAIIAWIFPGNDKMWKLWWSTFSKMLYIFPIIMGLLTVGRAFAYVVKMPPTEENAVVLTIVKLTAFIGPYFFIPKAFQMAGGAFANLAGMVNDRGKGMFDRQRKFRAEQRKSNREKLAQGNRIRPTGAIGRSRLGKGINNLGAGAFDTKDAMSRDGLIRGLSRAGRANSADRRRIHEQGLAAKDEVLATKGLNDNFLHMLEGVMKGTKDQELIDDLVANGYNDEQARVALAQGKNMYDHYGHGLAKIISDGKAASKTSQTADFSEFLRDVITLSHGDESMMMELLGSGKGAFAQAGRLSMSGGSFGEQAAMMKAMANVRPDGTYSGPSQISYFDEITGQNETIDMSGITTGSQVADMVNRRQRQKARDSFGTWDWSRVHPTDVKSLMTDIHSGVTQTAAQLRDPTLSASDREEKQRLLGQQLAQMQSLRANAMQSGNDEIQRIVANAFDKNTPIDIGMDGVQFSSISHLLEDMQGRATGQGVTRGNGKFARVEEMAEINPGILEGYRSVSKTGNMSAEQMEQLRQANTPR